MSRIVILGSSGMFGSMAKFLGRDAGHEVIAIDRATAPFDAEQPDNIGDLILPHEPDLVINAVGITHVLQHTAESRRAVILVNGLFPQILAELSQTHRLRMIHISSDGVFTGRPAPYSEGDYPDTEDDYGVSKRFGEPHKGRIITLRTSIIGPELNHGHHLLSWLLAHEDNDKATGYNDRIWHGVTTEQLARWCLTRVDQAEFDRTWNTSRLIHLVPNKPITKAELLQKCAIAFGRSITIRAEPSGTPLTRILTSNFQDTWAPLMDEGEWDDVLARLAQTSRTFYSITDKHQDRRYA